MSFRILEKLSIKIAFLFWIGLVFFIQWIIFGMPGISIVKNPPPKFLVAVYNFLHFLFSANYQF